MRDRIDLVLQDCVEMVRRGASFEACLARYPEHGQELEPLLEAALSVQGELTSPMPAAVDRGIRSRVLEEWDRRQFQRRRSWRLPYLMPRWAAVAAALVLAVLASGTGTVVAAAGSLPGDPLYLVKELREDFQLWFARSPEAKVGAYTQLVKQRADELRKLAAAGRVGSAPIAASRLERHVADVNRVMKESVESRSDGRLGADANFLENMDEYVRTQRSATGVLQEMLAQAPVGARADLERSIEAIELARNRVQAALESLTPVLPLAPETR